MDAREEAGKAKLEVRPLEATERQDVAAHKVSEW